MISRYAIIVILATCIFTTGLSAQNPAELAWQEAVRAQGGREKLLEVRSILVTSSSMKSVSLYVLPNKWWSLEDNRPSVFGVIMRMEDYSTRQNYRAQNGQLSAELRPIVEERLKQSLDENGNVIWMPAATFLLESKWWQPKVLGLRSGTIGRSKVDIVETELYGVKRDYYLDAKTHLVLKRVLFTKDSDGKESSYATEFYDYISVDGIMLPSKVVLPGSSAKQSFSYLVSPDYEESIFTRLPATPLTAKESWRRKR